MWVDVDPAFLSRYGVALPAKHEVYLSDVTFYLVVKATTTCPFVTIILAIINYALLQAWPIRWIRRRNKPCKVQLISCCLVATVDLAFSSCVPVCCLPILEKA